MSAVLDLLDRHPLRGLRRGLGAARLPALVAPAPFRPFGLPGAYLRGGLASEINGETGLNWSATYSASDFHVSAKLIAERATERFRAAAGDRLDGLTVEQVGPCLWNAQNGNAGGFETLALDGPVARALDAICRALPYQLIGVEDGRLHLYGG